MTENSASLTPPPAQPVATPKEGLLGLISVYYDPAATARRVQMRWFWIYPLIVISVVTSIVQLQMVPYVMPALRAQFMDQGMSGDQLNRTLSIAATATTVTAYAMPILVAIFTSIAALIILAIGAAVDVKVPFRTLFSLSMVCGMISLLQQIFNFVVVRQKGVEDIQSMKDVVQPFGLDIFIDAHGTLGALLAVTSVFVIWQLVMIALTYANIARVSKLKAFLITAPITVLIVFLAGLSSHRS